MVAKSEQWFSAVLTLPSFLRGRLSRCSLRSEIRSTASWISWSGWMNRLTKRLKSWCVQKAEVTEAFLSLKPLEKEWKGPAPSDIPTCFYRHTMLNRCLIHTENCRWFCKCHHTCDHTLICRQRKGQCLFVHGYSELIILRYNSVLYT